MITVEDMIYASFIEAISIISLDKHNSDTHTHTHEATSAYTGMPKYMHAQQLLLRCHTVRAS